VRKRASFGRKFDCGNDLESVAEVCDIEACVEIARENGAR
jgi:hypothetical protein